jgi:uncharacterized membrane-anchored protein YhcB (DUF1043 family)
MSDITYLLAAVFIFIVALFIIGFIGWVLENRDKKQQLIIKQALQRRQDRLEREGGK